MSAKNTGCTIGCLSLTVWLSLYGALGYVIYHFITKYW